MDLLLSQLEIVRESCGAYFSSKTLIVTKMKISQRLKGILLQARMFWKVELSAVKIKEISSRLEHFKPSNKPRTLCYLYFFLVRAARNDRI